jgi:hypothetical protein
MAKLRLHISWRWLCEFRTVVSSQWLEGGAAYQILTPSATNPAVMVAQA